MLGRVFATEGIECECSRAFFEGLAQQINAANGERY